VQVLIKGTVSRDRFGSSRYEMKNYVAGFIFNEITGALFFLLEDLNVCCCSLPAPN